MKVPLSWLRDYVDVDLAPEELANRLTMTGSKVERIEYTGTGWRDVLVGRIARLQPHPDPEVSLQLATVSLGARGEQTVVTGAFNIKEGDKVPYAGIGVSLPNGLTLKPRKLRGVVSEGMVLADDELGLGEDHSGIRILDPATPEGRPLSDVLGDAILDLEITGNRPDCLSIIGIAREVAAITGQELRLPGVQIVEGDGRVEDFLRVAVEVPNLCPRFTARIIAGVAIGPSPEKIATRLQLAGVRAINNIVDATNYVMLEYGQPTHAFDADTIVEKGLTVRLAREGETLRTLDGQTRDLAPDMLVIADGTGAPVSLAGVMGGATTEVSEGTTTVVLEAANWAPATIRRTATRLGLRSEASNRFEKGLPRYLASVVSDRAAALMAEWSGGIVARGMIEVGDVGGERRIISLPASEPRRLLGMEVSRDEIVNSLEPLGFETLTEDALTPSISLSRERERGSGGEGVTVVVPPWREDVVEEADLVEEVARMIGYDAIPETLLRGGVPAREVERGLYWMRQLRPVLLACGLSEVATHAMTGDAALERLRAPDAPEYGSLSEDEIAAIVPNAPAVTAAGATYGPARLQNGLSPERSVMRPTLMAGLLDALGVNLRNGRESVRLFELGRCYYPRVFEAPDPARLPALERRTLGIVLGGLREERSWDGPNVALDFYDLKGIAEELLACCGIAHRVVEPSGHPALHPGRAARLRLADRRGRPSTELAVLGEVHPEVAARFDLPERALVLELDVDALAAAATTARAYEEMSRYPSVRRDLAVVVGVSTPAADVLRAVRQGGGKLLQAVDVFDVYTGEQIGEGKKSLTISFVLQALDHTLTDREIDGVVNNIQRRLQDTVAATFRA